MKKKLIILLLGFILGTSFCSSQLNLESINAELIINNDLSVNEIINYSFSNKGQSASKETLILLYSKPNDFEITDENNRAINYSTSISNSIFVIKINDSIKPQESKNYFLKTYKNFFVANFGDSNVLAYNFVSYYDLDDFNLVLALPPNFGVIASQRNAINPLPSKIYSKNEQIVLEWRQKIRYMDSKNFIVFFEKTNANNSAIFLIILTFTISFSLGGATFFIILKRKKSKAIAMVLSNDEKKIVDLLSNNNEMFQSQIRNALDFSKPKLSKLVQSMASKKLIKIVAKGRQNKIILNKEIM